MTPAHWLLEVEIDGRTYRWSVQQLEVGTADDDTLLFAAGLDPVEAAEGQDSVSVAIVDPSVDWPALAPELEGRPATLLRWLEGDTYEQAVGYCSGRAQGVAYGHRAEPVTFDIISDRGADSLGVELPDAVAVVSDATWPISAAHETGNYGAYYPIILGYPGYRGYLGANDPTSYPIVPVPMAEWSDITSPAHATIVVAEDIECPVTTVWLRNDDTDVEEARSTTALTGTTVDKLGYKTRQVVIVDDEAMFPDKREARYFAGYYPAGGGGIARSAYDVIVYLLRRWGPESADWARLPEVADVLAPYQVDTWIDDVLTDPWVWIESALLPDLPVEVRTSRAGRYLVHRRYVSDRARRVGSVSADRGDVVRLGPVVRDNVGPTNEFTALYRARRDDGWLGRMVLAGDPALLRPTRYSSSLAPSTETELLSVVRSQTCLASYVRYGARQQEGGPREIDWTWDEGTVVQVLEYLASREALPARLIPYEVTDGEDLVEGDELLLTDSELGLSDAVAIVDTAPVRSMTTTTVLLRLPESA